MINVLDVALLNCCSYKCDYCIAKATFSPYIIHGEGDNKKYVHTNNGVSLKPHNLINFIRNNFKPNDVFVQLSGGEPTLHDAFVPLCHCLGSMGYTFIINTNASQLRQLFKSEPLNEWKCFWRCSWHPEMRSIEDFKKDIEMLPKDRILVNYVAHPKRIENGIIEDNIRELDTLDVKYEVTCFQGEYNCAKYDKNSSIYNKYATGLMQEGILAQSVNYLSIQANGNIMRCHKVKVGNIYVPELKERYPQGEVVCKYGNGNTNCGMVQALTLLGLLQGK